MAIRSLKRWHFDAIKLTHARTARLLGQGKGTTIAVLDGPIDLNSRELRMCTENQNHIIVPVNNVHELNTGSANTVHGTAMAEAIAGRNVGISPESKIVSVEIPFYISDGSESFAGREIGQSCCFMDDVLIGLRSIIDRMRDGSIDIDVVNISLGTPNMSNANRNHFCSLANELEEMGVAIAFAVGNLSNGANHSINAGPLFPARLGLGVVIGSGRDISDPTLNTTCEFTRSEGSRFGSCILGKDLPHVLSPGCDIRLSQVDHESNSTDPFSGTSTATAIASGVLALFLAESALPKSAPRIRGVYNCINDGARHLSTENGTPVSGQGFGLIDCYKSAECAETAGFIRSRSGRQR